MSATVTETLCAIRDGVSERVGDSRFRTWFGDGTTFDLSPEGLQINVQSAFAGRWIAANFLDEIREITHAVAGEPLPVEVRIVKREEANQRQAEPQRRQPSRAERHTRRTSDRRLRGKLKSFVVGETNRLAFVTAQQVANSPRDAFTPVVLHGGCGLGKTHLLQGIYNALAEQHPLLESRYLSGEAFTNEFIYAVKSSRVDAFRAKYRNVDVLLIDDVHFLANKEATQKEFLHTFDAIDAGGKVVVLSSDRHPRELNALGEPLINRLIAGMVVEVGAPDLETRREILRRRVQAMRCDVSEDVLDLVARRVTRNVRELEGAVYKLVALASLTREPLGVDLAEAALAEHFSFEQRPPSVAEIADLVCKKFGVTRAQLDSKGRDRTVSLARGVAMYLIRRHTAMSYPEIGRAMGNKNHSTVLMATQRVERLLAEAAEVTWIDDGQRRTAPLSGITDELRQRIAERYGGHG